MRPSKLIGVDKIIRNSGGEGTTSMKYKKVWDFEKSKFLIETTLKLLKTSNWNFNFEKFPKIFFFKEFLHKIVSKLSFYQILAAFFPVQSLFPTTPIKTKF